MMRLIDADNNTLDFDESFVVIEKDVSPFKEMMKKEDFSSYSISFDDSEEKISLKDAFLLLVNVKDSGSIYALFPKDEFNKEEITKRLTELKEMKISNNFDALEKNKKALSLLDEYHPYMYLYVEKNDYYLTKEELEEIYKGDTYIFIVEKEKEEALISEDESSSSEKKKFSFKEFFSPFKKYKYQFIFLTLASFLIGFAFSIGLFNSLLSNGISILFYVCMLVGAFLESFIYFDYFKEKDIKNKLFFYFLFFSILGSLLSMGAYSIYHLLDKSEGKENLSFLLLFFLSVGSSIIFIPISVFIGRLISKKKKK